LIFHQERRIIVGGVLVLPKKATKLPLRTPVWKYTELVAALGDDPAVAALIRSEGFQPPPVRTIGGWRVRNSIPPQWVPLLIEIAMRRKLLDKISHLRKEAA
jgi:hypothetical protein